MSNPFANSASRDLGEASSARISVPEIAERLNVGRQAVYAMLERGIMPGIRAGAADSIRDRPLVPADVAGSGSRDRRAPRRGPRIALVRYPGWPLGEIR